MNQTNGTLMLITKMQIIATAMHWIFVLNYQRFRSICMIPKIISDCNLVKFQKVKENLKNLAVTP